MFDTAAMAAKSSFWSPMRPRMSRSACTRSLAVPAARRRGIPRWYVARFTRRIIAACTAGAGTDPAMSLRRGGALRAGSPQRQVDQLCHRLDDRHTVALSGLVFGQDRNRVAAVPPGEVADAFHTPQVRVRQPAVLNVARPTPRRARR